MIKGIKLETEAYKKKPLAKDGMPNMQQILRTYDIIG